MSWIYQLDELMKISNASKLVLVKYGNKHNDRVCNKSLSVKDYCVRILYLWRKELSSCF